MTVVAAAITRQGVSIAADGQTTYGNQKSYGQTPKVWAAGGFAFGAAGCKRTAQVLRHHVDWPTFRPDEDDWETFLITQVVPAIRYGTLGHGIVSSEVGVETIDTTILIATGDYLGEISGNGCVEVPTVGCDAIGSGYAEALGHLGDTGLWTERDVVEAARRASVYAHGCGGPISVVNTRTMKVRTT